MKKSKLLILFLLSFILIASSISAGSSSQDYLNDLKKISKRKGDRKKATTLYNKAMANHKRKMYKESEKFWYEAAMTDPSWAKLYFNLACSTALQGKKKIAIEYLKITNKLAPKEYLRGMMKDSDLKSLRNLSAYKKLFPYGNHWVMDILEKKFTYSMDDGMHFKEKKTTILKADGTMYASGNASNSVPCDYSFHGGEWYIQAGKLIIKLNTSGECSGGGMEPYIKNTLNSKSDFLRSFSGNHYPGR